MNLDLEDTGFIKLTVKSADGGEPISQKIDVISVYNRMSAAWNEAVKASPEDSEAPYAAIAKVLESVGIPGVSHRCASDIFMKLGEQVTGFSGKEPTSANAE